MQSTRCVLGKWVYLVAHVLGIRIRPPVRQRKNKNLEYREAINTKNSSTCINIHRVFQACYLAGTCAWLQPVFQEPGASRLIVVVTSIRSTTRFEIPSSDCTRSPDEISTIGFSTKNTCVTLNGSGIQLAVGPQPLRLRNHNSGLAQRIMVKRLATSPHDPLGITDSACKNQLVVVSVQYGLYNPYIPIRSTTIGKSRVARDPIAMHTSWRSNSDIANSIGYPRMSASGESSTTMHRLLHASGSHPIPTPGDPKVSMTFRVVRTNQYNQDLRLIHSTNGNHLESPKEGSSIDHQILMPTTVTPQDFPEPLAQLRVLVNQISTERVQKMDDSEKLKDLLFLEIQSLEKRVTEMLEQQDNLYRATRLDDIRKDVDETKASVSNALLEFHAQAQENYNNLSSQLGELVAYINQGGLFLIHIDPIKLLQRRDLIWYKLVELHLREAVAQRCKNFHKDKPSANQDIMAIHCWRLNWKRPARALIYFKLEPVYPSLIESDLQTVLSMDSKVQSMDSKVMSLDSKVEELLNIQTFMKHKFNTYKRAFYEKIDTVVANVASSQTSLETSLVRQFTEHQLQISSDIDFVKLQLAELVNHLKEIGDAKKGEGPSSRQQPGLQQTQMDVMTEEQADVMSGGVFAGSCFILVNYA
ncbi:hypothetical protein F511_31516 [Dorcoceras hygrometricum]|uniref:Uncharacterized protein n=1 Tax=Dorcoceras hygrometricum TaxID=472368 RepID=A0A2Z7D5Y5_9LAMI|nr:hypothetical protein F511_31516 [Dorcoceras hygrometricum]